MAMQNNSTNHNQKLLKVLLGSLQYRARTQTIAQQTVYPGVSVMPACWWHGRQVAMSAKSASNVLDNVINMQGIIEA